MNEPNKCNLFVLGYNAVGKTTLINKITSQENIKIERTRGLETSDWIIKDLDKTVIVNVKERASFEQRVKGEFLEYILENSIIILVVSTLYKGYNAIWNDYLSEVPNNCIVIIFFNKLKENEFENINFKKLKIAYSKFK